MVAGYQKAASPTAAGGAWRKADLQTKEGVADDGSSLAGEQPSSLRTGYELGEKAPHMQIPGTRSQN